jgi:hypothetical protein
MDGETIKFTKEAVERSGGFKIGQVNRNVKFVDKLVLLVMEETVLQGVIDRVIEIGICYGMEMDVKESKVVRILRQSSSIQIMIDYK